MLSRLTAVVVFCASLSCACRHDLASPNEDNSTLTISPTSASLYVGDSAVFIATLDGMNLPAESLAWESSDASKATVSAHGVVRALAVSSGVVVCAVRIGGIPLRACAPILVADKGAQPLPASLALSPSYAELFLGDSLVLKATLNGALLSSALLEWTSTDSSKVVVTADGIAQPRGATNGIAVCASLRSAVNVRGCAAIVVIVKGVPGRP